MDNSVKHAAFIKACKNKNSLKFLIEAHNDYCDPSNPLDNVYRSIVRELLEVCKVYGIVGGMWDLLQMMSPDVKFDIDSNGYWWQILNLLAAKIRARPIDTFTGLFNPEDIGC